MVHLFRLLHLLYSLLEDLRQCFSLSHRFWSRLLCALAGGILVWCISLSFLAWSQSNQVTVVLEGVSYTRIVEQSQAEVWQAATQQFSQFPEQTQVVVDVLAKAGGGQVPVMTVTVDRQEWEKGRKSFPWDRFSRVYTQSQPLFQTLTDPTSPPSFTFEKQTPSPEPNPVQNTIQNTLRGISTTPKDQAKNVSVKDPIRLQFNQLLPEDLQQLRIAADPELKLVFELDKDTLILQPVEPLRYSTDYTLVVNQVTSDPLQDPIQIRFRTEPQYTYVEHIQPLLEASCVGCHQQNGRMRRSPLEPYTSVMTYVIPGSAESELIDPQWTRRHAQIQRATVLARSGLPATPTPSPTFLPFQKLDRGPGSPEIAYVLKKGTPVQKLGFWDPSEVEIVRTWIVQDKAPEKRSLD